MKFGVMRGPAGKSPYLVTPEIWRKGHFAPFFERPESASMTSLRLVSGGEHRFGNGIHSKKHVPDAPPPTPGLAAVVRVPAGPAFPGIEWTVAGRSRPSSAGLGLDVVLDAHLPDELEVRLEPVHVGLLGFQDPVEQIPGDVVAGRLAGCPPVWHEGRQACSPRVISCRHSGRPEYPCNRIGEPRAGALCGNAGGRGFLLQIGMI